MNAHKRSGWIATAIVVSMVATGCVGAASDVDTGSIGMELQIAPGIAVSTVTWTINNASTGFSRSESINVRSSNTLAFLVGAIPTGTGYTISLAAASIDGSFVCSGSAGFDITRGTTPVSLTLNCSTAPAGQGTIVVKGTTQLCANLDSISASPLETAVSTTIQLSATASLGSFTPTFAWTATAGTFDNPALAAPKFTCPATAGEVTITATASPSASSCNTSFSQSVTVTCDTLPPTFANVYASILGARCTSCHRPGGSGVNVGKLDLSTPAAAYANLIGVAASGTGAGTSGVTCASVVPALVRVIPNDAANSLLFNKLHTKLDGTLAACGSPMPLPATAVPLTAAEVDLVSAWIGAGALSN